MKAETKTLAEITEDAMRILVREIGLVNTVRFINQFTTVYGNYTEERRKLFADQTLSDWNEGNCNTDHTIVFLKRIAEWLGKPERPVLIIWDGAPWHRAIQLRERAEELGLQLMPLPGYSPDLNPIEGLWKWMREAVTQHHSYPTMRDLFQACKDFIDRVNLDPDANGWKSRFAALAEISLPDAKRDNAIALSLFAS